MALVRSNDLKDFNISIIEVPKSISKPELIPMSYCTNYTIQLGPGYPALVIPQLYTIQMSTGSIYGQGFVNLYTYFTISFSDNVRKKIYFGFLDFRDLLMQELTENGGVLPSVIIPSVDYALPYSKWTIFVGYVSHKIKIRIPPTDFLDILPFKPSAIVTEVLGFTPGTFYATNIQPFIIVDGTNYGTLATTMINYQMYGFYRVSFTNIETNVPAALYLYNTFYNYAKYINLQTGQII